MATLRDEIDALNDRAWSLRNNHVEQARALLEEARELSTTGEFAASPYHKGLIRSLTGLGYIHRISGDLNKAMVCLTEARQLSDATGLLGSIVFVNLGSLYTLLGDLLQGLQAYEKGLAAARQSADSRYETEALMGIANVYAMRTDFPEAIAYVKQSLELSINTRNLSGQLRASNNLAAIYQTAGDYANAQIIIEQALPLIDDQNLVFETIYVLATAGEVQFSLGNYQQALVDLQAALSLSEKAAIVEATPGILVSISKVYREQAEIEQEIDVLHRAIEVSEAFKHLDSQHVCHERLAAIYERRGDFETALKHYKQFHDIKAIIFNEAADQKLKSLQVLYETEAHKQAAEIAHLRNIELAQANEAVEAVNRVKSAFLANMSHELRTPINAIYGFAQLMQYDPNLSTANHENLKAILHSSEHLLELINDVLDMSKIEAEKMTLQPSVFDCCQLFDQLKAMFSASVKQKNLAFSLDCDPDVPRWIKTDERKLRQVLLNLIGNAIKFTAAGRVDLRVAYADARLHFEVEDTGQGIAPEDLAVLFTPFHQAERQEATEKGTGLGLAISQAFVQLLGDGRITVTSELGKGSVFRFDLPVEVSLRAGSEETATPRPVKALATGQPSYRILVADDHADGRTALVQLLRLIGFEVQAAVDGQQAVEASRAWQPHLIFMDLRMPELDGYAAARQIKQRDPQIKIVAVTSNGVADEQVTAAGFDDFMLKPLPTDQLLATIARHLSVRYEYEAASSSAPTMLEAREVRARLQVQPASWRQAIHYSAMAGNRNEILRLVDELDREDPELAAALRLMMKEYRFEKLIALIEPATAPSDSSG